MRRHAAAAAAEAEPPENDALFPACSGFLKTRRQVYLIEPLGGSDDGEHAVFRREQLKVSGTRSCGSVAPYDGDPDPKPASLWSRSRVSV